MVKRFSIKYKLLLLLLVIPIVSLLLYLLLARDIFQKDKIAYVFSTGLQHTKTMAIQFQIELQMAKQTEKLILSGVDLTKNMLDALSKKIMDESSKVLLFELYKVQKNKKAVNVIHKTSNSIILTDDLKNQLEKLKKGIFKALSLTPKKEVVRVIDPENSVMVLARLFDSELIGGKYYSLLLFRAKGLFLQFNNVDIFKNFIVKEDGTILLGFKKIWDNQVGGFGRFGFFQKIMANKFEMGTLETGLDEGEPQLVSYVKIEETGHLALSFLEKRFALQATRNLVQKSIFFLIFIFSATLIVSVFASRKLTFSLRQLYLGTTKIEQGDFNIKVSIKSNDEVGELGHSFNIMAQKISSLLFELQEYNEKLEIMVEERTADLQKALQMQKAMVDGLNQGLFIFDITTKALPVYSRPSETIFETIPSGKYVDELLNISEENKDSFRELCKNLILEELLDFNDLIEMAPHYMENSQKRKIYINYTPIRNSENKVSGVVVIATDKTDEIEAIKKAQHEREYVQMVIKILSDKSLFMKFVSDSFEEISKLKEIVRGKLSSKDKKSILFRKAHTLKGTSATFHLDEIAETCHEMEDIIASLYGQYVDTDLPLAPEIEENLVSKIEEVENEFNEILKNNQEVLKLESWEDHEPKVEINFSTVRDHYRMLLEQRSHTQLTTNFFNLFYSRPIKRLLNHYNDVIQQVARARKKIIAPVKVFHNDIRIVEENYFELFESLIHIFRNIVDHGIESPEDRKRTGKTQEGNVKIEVTETTEDHTKFLEILISDDGKGIDPNSVKEKIRELGRWDEIATKSNEEIIQHIFDGGVTTKEEVTEISGRGVGMDVVKDEVEKLNGTVWVESQMGVGTSFKIRFPRNDLDDILNLQ